MTGFRVIAYSMDEYVERHRARLSRQDPPQQVQGVEEVNSPIITESASNPSLLKLHILPLQSEISDRTAAGLRAVRECRGINEGSVIENFVVVRCEPLGGGQVTTETEVFVDGPIVPRLSRLQLVLIGDPLGSDPDVLFSEVVEPYLTQRLSTHSVALFSAGGSINIAGRSFLIAACEPNVPAGSLVAADRETLIYLTRDDSEEFTRIHVVPFQDTLPRAYDFDLFRDYLRPFFRTHAADRFSADQQFTYLAVQFRIVAAEPADRRPRRVGANTMIYCDGVLHPSMRHVLPPELLEQLAMLPPGLQLLLMNTDALAGVDMYERMAGLQETLSTRRGLSEETIALMPPERWQRREAAGSSQEQCMVCLAEFTDEDQVRRLPCLHEYHCACIDEWLRRCTDCPLCKANVDRALRGY